MPSPKAVLLAPFHGLLRDPKVSGALLFAILWCPEKLRKILPARLYAILTSQAGIRLLQALFGINGLRRVNAKLSEVMLNNWKGAARFTKSQELVLITGGSRGIGKCMALDFAKRGVKVVILDMDPPEATMRELTGRFVTERCKY